MSIIVISIENYLTMWRALIYSWENYISNITASVVQNCTCFLNFFYQRIIFVCSKLIICWCRMLFATQWACQYRLSYHGSIARTIYVEASKMRFLPDIITGLSRSATTTESFGLAIGGKYSSSDPLHSPKISTRNM